MFVQNNDSHSNSDASSLQLNIVGQAHQVGWKWGFNFCAILKDLAKTNFKIIVTL